MVTEDEAVVVSAGGGGHTGEPPSVRCWDLVNGQLLTEYNGHEDAPTGLCLVAGGRQVASLDAGGAVHVWASSTGGPRGPLTVDH